MDEGTWMKKINKMKKLALKTTNRVGVRGPHKGR
jgi:hypothetical protein